MVFSKSQTFAYKYQHFFLSLKRNLEKSIEFNFLFGFTNYTEQCIPPTFHLLKTFSKMVFNCSKTWKSVELSFQVSTWDGMWTRNQICISNILTFLWRSYFRNPLLSYSTFEKNCFDIYEGAILSRKTHVLQKFSMNVSMNLVVPDW